MPTSIKKFRPTKIVIECDVTDSSKVLNYYSEYLKDNYQFTRNETNQIGFRLAKELNHAKVYCVDWGIFPDDPLYNYQTYSRTEPEMDTFLNNWMKTTGEEYEKENQALNKLSVLDQLRHLNQKERIEASHQGYFDLMRIGLGDKYVGANYLSWWYGRNMKILVNIIRMTTSADDRILVIYGSGHVKLLTQFAQESEFYDVADPIELLKD